MKIETKSKDLLRKDEKYIWHAMRRYNPEATMVIQKADGAWIEDNNGKKIFRCNGWSLVCKCWIW